MTLPASCVALEGRGLLILGEPGAGKSTLALELMALGAELVADDIVLLSRVGDRLRAAAPPRLAGMIEARGIGLLDAPHRDGVLLSLAIDLDHMETQRLPQRRRTVLHGVPLDFILRPDPLSAGVIAAALRFWPPRDPEAPHV